jgi:prepilin-type N-terminal cleavage/methylation domain-containing protein
MNATFIVRYRGFTLVESLITIAVIGIFAAIAAPSFITWLSDKKIDDATAQIEGAIRATQAEAIKKSQSCTLNIGLQVTSTPPDCLPSGPRDLTKLDASIFSNNNSDVLIGTVNLNSPPSVLFTFRGTISIAGSGTGLITVYSGTVASNQKTRCIAISSGIGIIRTGRYSGADPNSPVETACMTNMP